MFQLCKSTLYLKVLFVVNKYKVRVFVYYTIYNKKLINIKIEFASKCFLFGSNYRLKTHIELWVVPIKIAQSMTYIYWGLWCSQLLWKLHFFYNILDFFESKKSRKLWIVLCKLPAWHLFESFHGLFKSKEWWFNIEIGDFDNLLLRKSDWK